MKDSYKPLFCAPHFYSENQSRFQLIKQFIDQSGFTHSNDPTTCVILWITFLCLLRRPHRWFGGLHKGYDLNHTLNPWQKSVNQIDLNYISFLKNLGVGWPQKLSHELSFYDFLNMVRIQPLPEAAQKALFCIFTKKYPMTILDYEPDPTELLHLQCQGKRVITFTPDYTDWPNQKFGQRDPLSFWLHDCIHAEHFFAQPEIFTSQIGFYKFVAASIKNNCWPKAFSQRDDFSYLISDMNSHPIHLFKTLKALSDIHYKDESMGIWQNVLNTCATEPAEINALRNLNTTYFTDDDSTALLQMTKRLGAQGYFI